MSRYAVAWIALGLLVLSCFSPWVTVTTYANQTANHGALEDAFSGGFYLLGLAGLAALGLLARRPALAMTCAVLAVILTAVMSLEAPETMLQFGWMAELTWGTYLAFASSFTLVFAARSTSRVTRQTLA
jgi:hypothetical protein